MTTWFDYVRAESRRRMSEASQRWRPSKLMTRSTVSPNRSAVSSVMAALTHSLTAAGGMPDPRSAFHGC